MRDTQTVPCWLAEYEGELYYLGIQTDMNGEWTPPSLGHRVLVEGTMAPDTSRICGGIVLKPIVTSVLPELDPTCNSTVLPAEDRYTVPFASLGAGPGKGPKSESTPNVAAQSPQSLDDLSAAKSFVILYDFDNASITAKTSRVLAGVVRFIQAHHPSRIEIVGYRGAVLLSNGNLLVEKTGISEDRAKRMAQLLNGAGVDSRKVEINWRDKDSIASGANDFVQRRVEVTVISNQ